MLSDEDMKSFVLSDLKFSKFKYKCYKNSLLADVDDDGEGFSSGVFRETDVTLMREENMGLTRRLSLVLSDFKRDFEDGVFKYEKYKQRFEDDINYRDEREQKWDLLDASRHDEGDWDEIQDNYEDSLGYLVPQNYPNLAPRVLNAPDFWEEEGDLKEEEGEVSSKKVLNESMYFKEFERFINDSKANSKEVPWDECHGTDCDRKNEEEDRKINQSVDHGGVRLSPPLPSCSSDILERTIKMSSVLAQEHIKTKKKLPSMEDNSDVSLAPNDDRGKSRDHGNVPEGGIEEFSIIEKNFKEFTKNFESVKEDVIEINESLKELKADIERDIEQELENKLLEYMDAMYNEDIEDEEEFFTTCGETFITAESNGKLWSDEQSLRSMKTKAIGAESFDPGGKGQPAGASMSQKSKSSSRIPVKVRLKGKAVDKGSAHTKSIPQIRSEMSPWSLIEQKVRASTGLIVYKKEDEMKSHGDRNTGTSCKEIYKHPDFNPARAGKQKQKLRYQGK